VGPRAGLDVCEKSRPTRIRSLDRPARSQSLYRLSYPAHTTWQGYNDNSNSWIIKSLEIIGINNKVISYVNKVMPHCRTRMCLHAEQKPIKTEDKNRMWNISGRLTITTAILHLFDPSH
jgi:hypothetical protein